MAENSPIETAFRWLQPEDRLIRFLDGLRSLRIFHSESAAGARSRTGLRNDAGARTVAWCARGGPPVSRLRLPTADQKPLEQSVSQT